MKRHRPKSEQDWVSRCWRPESMPGVVMFHGRHRQAFLAHAHEVFTVIQLTDGQVRISVDGRDHLVAPGQLVLIGSNQLHSARPLDSHGWSMRSLHLPRDFFVDAGTPVGGPLHFSCPVYQGASTDQTAFEEWHCACEEGQNARAERAFRGFAQWLRASIMKFSPHVDRYHLGDPRIEQAKQLLADNVFGHDTLDQVAREVGMSSFALIRGFTKTYGLPPHAWRMQARARAAEALIKDRQCLADVAGICGFTDQSHLARVFKRVYGVTPGQYRAMH